MHSRSLCLFVVFVACGFFVVPSFADAATLYWVGGAGDDVTVNANDWSAVDLGVCNDTSSELIEGSLFALSLSRGRRA